MPAALKVFNVSTTTAITIYTCPAGRVAKVIIGAARLSTSGLQNAYINAAGIPVIRVSSGTGGYAYVNVNNADLNVGAGNAYRDMYGAEPLIAFLNAGEALTTTDTSGGTVTASICIVEELE